MIRPVCFVITNCNAFQWYKTYGLLFQLLIILHLIENAQTALVQQAIKDNIARVKVKRWVIYLKFVTQTYGGESSVTINSTRMYVHYSNKDFFYFKLQRKGLLNILGKLIGIKYIEVGYPDFDRDFIIKGNDESKVRSLFGNPIIRSLIEVQPYIFFKLKGNVLYFQENSIIYDIKRLKSLYQLFVETLNQLYSERSRKPRQKRKVKHRN